jgi:hypothetical protein
MSDDRYDAMFAALCSEVGFCLHDKGQKRVIASLPEGLDAATKVAFAAAGVDYLNSLGDHRRAVRDCLKAHLPKD